MELRILLRRSSERLPLSLCSGAGSSSYFVGLFSAHFRTETATIENFFNGVRAGVVFSFSDRGQIW